MSTAARRPPPLGPTLVEYVFGAPTQLERVVDVHGDQHSTDGACGCDSERCEACLGVVHYQALFGGYWASCADCDGAIWACADDLVWQHRRGLVRPSDGGACRHTPFRADECDGEIEASS